MSNQAGKHLRHQIRYQRRNQKGLATWVKVLIGVMIVGTISIIALLAGGFFLVNGAVKDMTDPNKIKANAASIAKLPDPLPKGWKLETSLNLFGFDVAMFFNQKENLNITFLKMPSPGKGNTDEIVDAYAEKGVPNLTGSTTQTTAKLEVKEKGEMTVGGESMKYAVGTSNSNGKSFAQLIGCVMPKTTKSIIIVQGLCLNSETFNLEEAKAFLSTIKGF